MRVLPPPNVGAGFTASPKRSTEQFRSNIYELRYRSGAIMGGRQAACGCRMINKKDGVSISRDKDGRDFYTGVQTCGSVWTCPVCSLKISQQRKIEVQDILMKMQNDGNALGFLTLTWKHSADEDLRTVLKRGTEMYRTLMKQRAVKDLRSGCNVIGDIRAIEIKFGHNGWHPHLHIAIVADAKPDILAAYASAIIGIWCALHGDNADNKAQKYKQIYTHEGIADYITKWSAADEMTKANAKVKSSTGSLTPFALLECAGDKSYSEKQRKYFCAKFREYGKAMKGRKQLTKGRNLIEMYKDICMMMHEAEVDQNKTDEEIANAKHKGELQFAMESELYEFTVEQKLQAHILNAYASGGISEVMEMFLEFGLILNINWGTMLLTIEDSG